MPTYSMAACKGYAHGLIFDALTNYNLVEYQSELTQKVNDIALEMGYGCKDDKPEFQRLSEQLTDNICSISNDDTVTSKIFAYANRVMEIGRNYLSLETGH